MMYFDLEATFRGYIAKVIIPSDTDLYMFGCRAIDVVNIYAKPPSFVTNQGNQTEILEQWENFKRIIIFANLDQRVCFLLKDDYTSLTGTTLEENYLKRNKQSRFWYGRDD